jgi:hypothetical protein
MNVKMIKKKLFIIGLLVIAGLTIRAESAHALYSPRISRQVAVIQQHIQESQAQNGTGDVLDTVESGIAYDRARREAYESTGVSGNVRVAQELIYNSHANRFIDSPLNPLFRSMDSLLMAFNLEVTTGRFISNCLRDDIWGLERLREIVGQEMIRAYMLLDTLHGRLLLEDYKYLNSHIKLLRKYGSDPYAVMQGINQGSDELISITSNQYFFGTEPEGTDYVNYYSNVFPQSSDQTGCPDGEFESAFEQVANSWDALKGVVGGNSLFSKEGWGNIWQMAEANARIRARQWIRANQISLTLGGESGARIQSLTKGGGWDKFVGTIRTQLRILKDLVGPVTPLFDKANYQSPAKRINTTCVVFSAETNTFISCSELESEQYKKCKKNKKKAEEEEGIRCDRFRDTEEHISAANRATRQQALQAENEAAKQEVETAFVYHISLDSVGENAIYQMDDILWDMNQNIKRGFEAFGNEAGAGIPSLTLEVQALTKNQCSNK